MDNTIKQNVIGQTDGYDITVTAFYEEDNSLLSDWLGYFTDDISTVDSFRVINHSNDPSIYKYFVASEVEDEEQAQHQYNIMMAIEDGRLYHFGVEVSISKYGIPLGSETMSGLVDNDVEQYFDSENEFTTELAERAITEATEKVNRLTEAA